MGTCGAGAEIREGFPPSERPKGYWLFFVVVVALVVFGIFLLYASA